MANPVSDFVQVPPQSTGRQIDAVDVTTSSGGTQLRQTVVPADPLNIATYARVDTIPPDVNGPRGGLMTVPQADAIGAGVLAQIDRTLSAILLELRAINMSLASMVPAPVLSSELSAGQDSSVM